MSVSRRHVLTGAAALAALALGRRARAAAPPPRTILILGGTGFLGPHLVDAARVRGHKVTLFNRGKTRPGLFPDVEKLHGDRDGHLEALAGTRRWDAVIDPSGYVPRLVGASAKLLAPRVGQYVFISTISVFGEAPPKAGPDEAAPVAKAPDPKSEDVRQFYGALKALSEQAAEAALPGRATSIRPGLIVGPGDPTDRFTYWPVRLDRGGAVLAPGDGEDPVQVIDVRDLARWTIHCVEERFMGTYNAVGPAATMTMKTMLAGIARGLGKTPALRWAAAPFLEANKVGPWMDMPTWIPRQSEETGMTRIRCGKAIARGLRFRPIDETARDTLAWWKMEPPERRAKLRAGITPEREAEVLAALARRP